MSLTAKIAAILTALILSITTVGAIVQRSVFGGRFDQIEREEAGAELSRVREALSAEIETVARSARRLGRWEPTRSFVGPERGRNEAFIAENLSDAVLEAEDLDLVVLCDAGGRVLAHRLRDPDTGDELALSDFPNERLSTRHPLLAWTASEAERRLVEPSGVLLTERAPLLVAVERVVGSGDRMAGFAIVGRFLGDDLSDRISERTRTTFSAWPVETTPDALPDDIAERLDRITGSAAPVVATIDDGGAMAVYATFDDIQRRPTLVLRATMERSISDAARTTLLSGGLTDATIGLAILLGLLLTLNVVVLKPIRALTDHAVRTGQNENFRAKFGLERSDEIGTLGEAFDEMMAKLEQARSALVETARTAGMSEIATGILHNVGNVLNSVNISAALVSQRVDGLCIDDLERLAEVVKEHKDDLAAFLTEDPRGQHIEPFLSALVDQLAQEQRAIKNEVTSLTDGIDHICELVKSQQNLAKGTALIEPTNLAMRMDEALRITQRVHGVDDDLVVVRRYDEIDEVDLDKHKLLEILVNLVQNARQAMHRGEGVRELTLELRQSDGDHVLLAVADTGVGISSDDLTRVFNMGFTTRDEGHGFGLHSSANAANEMGGRLWAESDGPGQGARFLLELPFVPPGHRSNEPSSEEGGVAYGGAA
ncbi:MAG: ATP-binding protein [Planctomycetota bacterium]